jgi:UPF0755 protein
MGAYFQRRKKKKSFKTLVILMIVAALLIVGFNFGWKYYIKIFEPNVLVNYSGEDYYLKIPTGSTFEDMVEILKKEDILSDVESFVELAKYREFDEKVQPGRYFIKPNSSNYELIDQLRGWNNMPIKLVINQIRFVEDLAGFLGSQLEFDSASFMNVVMSQEFLNKHNLDKDNVLCFFLPDTYEFYWNTSIKDFLDRIQKYNDEFWTEERINKASSFYLTKNEVIVLASIVQEEAYHVDEMPKIAGVFINRLRRGWPLQSDPTLKYAHRDFTIKRVKDEHKEIESPYNTYKYANLPPGPIIMPQKNAIDAVLNAEDHNYMFFVAKADMSMYHNFSTNLTQHNRYAREYRRKLNELNIR